MTRFVTRALQAVRRYDATPEQIDYAILAAINATLCLCSGGDDLVAEGFNHDIASNGARFASLIDYRQSIVRQVMARETIH